jgi:hypothetical protein
MEITLPFSPLWDCPVTANVQKVFLQLAFQDEETQNSYESWWKGWAKLKRIGGVWHLCGVPLECNIHSKQDRLIIQEDPQYDPPRNGGPATLKVTLTLQKPTPVALHTCTTPSMIVDDGSSSPPNKKMKISKCRL